MKVMLTGAAGFIGMHVALKLLARGDVVVGIDNLNDYYDVALKQSRLELLKRHGRFSFERVDVADRAAMSKLFERERPERVVHLAAQAGVRYSLINPDSYVDSNITGFLSMLEGCRHHDIEHLVYASSSSVYGGSKAMPFTEQQSVDHPISLYAATKKANELMAHTYSHLFRVPTTGLRFFTVYGPWGRPDMALFLFTKAILEGKPIDVFNHGKSLRDFTYIDDVAESVVRVLDRVPQAAASSATTHPGLSDMAPFRVFNVGNRDPVLLTDFIDCIERCIGKTSERRLLENQPGDVAATIADTRALREWIGFEPSTSIQAGVERFVAWYRQYYKL